MLLDGVFCVKPTQADELLLDCVYQRFMEYVILKATDQTDQAETPKGTEKL